ncbi:MAG TPA: DegT/DnrJ/EryC1/StrS family aminotransferase [Gaiellales bacterium]
MSAVSKAPWKVPLADVQVTEDDIEAVAETYRSGWLSQGPRTREFEQAIEQYTGAPHAIAMTNCTAALHLMALAAGLGPGDEAIVPSLTFVATANAIAYTGATPVFADVVSLTEPWLDPEAVAKRITPRTKAIVCMQYGGHPGETLALRALAAEHGLILLEDSAHAIGTRIGDEHAGTLGFAGAYSFFSNKNLAVGEGGMVVCRDEETAEKLRLLRSHGMTTLSWQRHQGHAASYDVVALGFNFRIDEARSALGTNRLARLDGENRQRAAIDAHYRELLADVPHVTAALAPPEGSTLAHHLFTVVLGDGVDRDAVRERLSASGVQSSIHYPPAHWFEIYSGAGDVLPVTEEYARRTLTLPMYGHMTHEQTELVVSALDAACSE